MTFKKLISLAAIVAVLVSYPHPAFATAPTALTVASVVEAGVLFNPASADTANGNSFDNTNGDVFVIVQNTHATLSETFNFTVQNATKTVDGWGSLTKTNPLAITVAALTIRLVGPFPKSAYNDATSLVQVTYSGSGTPKIQAFKVTGLIAGGST